MRFLSSCGNSFSVVSESPDDTFDAGRAFGEFLYPGLLILLAGGLGMGKTRFVQGIGKAVGYDRVKSPSFVIMNEYDADVPFLHVDLYRLEDAGEADLLGIEEYLDCGFAAAVEWAERWTDPLKDRIAVRFLPAPGGCDSRELAFKAFGRRETDLLAKVKKRIIFRKDK